MDETQILEVPITGMDCAECTQHVQHAIASLPGVRKVEVFLATEKAIIELDAAHLDLAAIRSAVRKAGYDVPASDHPAPAPVIQGDFHRRFTLLLAGLFVSILGAVIFGEWLGWFDILNASIPFPLGVAIVLLGGYPVFLNVLRATIKGQIISHTLMTLGVLAALAVGEWVTAALVVAFMRVGDYVERFTTDSARHAVRELSAIAPQTARVERDGKEQEVPITQIRPGEIVVVRPGEKIPVDGEVVAGQATVEQATITGESMPVEVAAGSRVYAATFARLGSLRIRAERIGADTTFGHIIHLVEQAEANRAEVQRFADRFSGWYLPLVAGLAAITYLLSRNPLATAAVLLVACSCSIALATPIAMLASIGASAKRGLLIKGGKVLEMLAGAEILLLDKTGTVTLGRPEVKEVILTGNLSRREVLTLAASAERYSEHPLAEAVRNLAQQEGIPLLEVEEFVALPGQGVQAKIFDQHVRVGKSTPSNSDEKSWIQPYEAQGKTVLNVEVNGKQVALLTVADTLRPEVPAALDIIRSLGIQQIELLTGDNEHAAAELANTLGITYHANLLPEDKIAIVQEYQSRGKRVVMVGDGVNDAPALAQADVGIAMGAIGSDIAIEAAHIALLCEDWMLVAEAIKIAKRTMSVVQMNLMLTALYNLVGLTLAATGILSPVLAAAAQSLPDIGILGNSARLLKQR